MVHADDQQLVGFALVVDSEWRNGPTPHSGTGLQPGNRALEFLRSQAIDALCDLGIEVRSCRRVSFVEVADPLDDVGDRSSV
jgi:hypothetical protein